MAENIKSLAVLELSIAVILFLIRISLFAVAYFSQILTILNLIYAVILILMIATYALISINYKRKEAFYIHSLLLAAFIVAFFASYLIQPSLSYASLLQTLSTIQSEYLYLPLFFFLVFLGSLAAYLIRIKKKIVLGYGIFIILFVLLTIILLWTVHAYFPDDEILASFYGMQILFHGGNPYNTSIAGTLYYLYRFGNSYVSTFTTNQVPSGIVYPSLYLFSSIPFYLLSQPTLYNLEHIDLPIQITALLTLMLFTILMKISKEEILKPKFLLIIFLTLFIYSLTSITVFLMAALLFIAYLGLREKYAWLLIGLCISLQEELWFPCLLLIIYSFNNYGTKKSMQTLIGAAIVFFAFNAYFILLNPSAFINSVFLGSFVYGFPNITGPIGYFLLSSYHILIGSLSTVFILILFLLAIIFAVLNRKELVLLFSMVPYFFFSHVASLYYALPFLVFISVLYSPQIKEGTGRFMKYLHSNAVSRYATYIIIIAIVSATLTILYLSHSEYISAFNLSITNQSLIPNGNTMIYTADLTYKNLGVNYVYFGLHGLSGYAVYEYGFNIKQVLSNNQSSCNSYNCTINMNRIPINSSAGIIKVQAVLTPDKNQTIRAVSGVVYNYNYFYTSETTYKT